MNDNQPFISLCYQKGEALAVELLRKVIDDASYYVSLDKVGSFKVSREVRVPADKRERDAFLDGFWGRVRANTGLIYAENVKWTFTISAGYDGPSDHIGQSTGVNAKYRPEGYRLPVPVVYKSDPEATFFMSLYPVEKREPEIVK